MAVCVFRRRFVPALGDSEVKNLHEVKVLAIPTEEDVGGLDVAMDEPGRFGFGQRMAHLSKDVDGAFGRDRAEALDQLVRINSVEQLHHVIERAVLGDAEVEQRHRVGRSELGDDLRFPLESSSHVIRDSGRVSRP